MKNHLSCLTSFTPLLEAHGKSFNNYGENNGQGCGHGIDVCFHN